MEVISHYTYIDPRSGCKYTKHYKKKLPKKKYINDAVKKNINNLDENHVKYIVEIIEYFANDKNNSEKNK